MKPVNGSRKKQYGFASLCLGLLIGLARRFRLLCHLYLALLDGQIFNEEFAVPEQSRRRNTKKEPVTANRETSLWIVVRERRQLDAGREGERAVLNLQLARDGSCYEWNE